LTLLVALFIVLHLRDLGNVMPIPSQFSLSLELTKLLPAQAALTYGVDAIVSLARELRRSGSDFLVEEDLAAIFSRGRVVSSLETHFRDVVKVASFTPLHAGSEIILDAGPGPTVRRALKDRYYMATVIQLSCLCFLHETTSLAGTMVECMHKRYELGIKGANSDADYDGILATLLACKSQTSHYPWEMLVSLVESRFERSAQWFRAPQSRLRRLSANLLQGAMDYLYLVQSLPEDRIMMVENQMGLVPVVVWAHCILGLTVLVKGSLDGDVIFGRSSNPQVIINWSHELKLSWNAQDVEEPSIQAVYLLDGDMDVVLSIDTENDKALEIEGEERVRLRGYGTTFLRRFFNKHSIVVDDDQLYTELLHFTIASAIAKSKVLHHADLRDEYGRPRQQSYIETEYWRIMTSSEMLFSGITFDKEEIDHYVKKNTNSHSTFPPMLGRHLEKADNGKNHRSKSFRCNIGRLASWILGFAQIVGLEACSDMPLIFDPQHTVAKHLKWDDLGPVQISPNLWYNLIVTLMVSRTEKRRYPMNSGFLFSHCGWSVFLNWIGDIDPGNANPGLLSLKGGVPTSIRTNERKYQIADAQLPWTKGNVRKPLRVDIKDSYLPRCLSPVSKRTEQYSSRGLQFLLAIRYDIDESRAPLHPGEEAKFSVYASYSQFHEEMWNVFKTLACPHQRGKSELSKLDLGVVTAKGFNWFNEKVDERVCIILVKGDARAWWLAVAGCPDPGIQKLVRHIMLRCDDCCEDCAVQTAIAMEGKWLVVL